MTIKKGSKAFALAIVLFAALLWQSANADDHLGGLHAAMSVAAVEDSHPR